MKVWICPETVGVPARVCRSATVQVPSSWKNAIGRPLLLSVVTVSSPLLTAEPVMAAPVAAMLSDGASWSTSSAPSASTLTLVLVVTVVETRRPSPVVSSTKVT
ncbi:MAG: hypothetical protein HND58_16655 [Planctomycetota bacterium]|nr:MAG: hypothetical protein HND58_16655 [Planctomycetota bacterium]